MQGLEAALGHCSHHTFISSLRSDGLLTEPRRSSCVGAHLRIYPFPKSNSDVPERALGGGGGVGGVGAEEVTETRRGGALCGVNLIVIAETEAAITRRADRESECNGGAGEDSANRVSGVISSLQWGWLLWKPLTCLFQPFVSVQTPLNQMLIFISPPFLPLTPRFQTTGEINLT